MNGHDSTNWEKLLEGAFEHGDSMPFGVPNFGNTDLIKQPYDRQGAYANAMIYPGNTAVYYINEQQLREIRAWSRAWARDNPYWQGIQRNRIVYTAVGHQYTVTAKKKDDPAVTAEDIDACREEIETFCLANRYDELREEKVTRKDRDGEYILRYFDEHADGVLRVRFVEPLLLWTPPGKSAREDVWFGVQFDGDYEDPQGYYIRSANYLGTTISDNAWQTMVPADEIQHRKANVDRGNPRGLPTTYLVMARLEQAVKNLTAIGKLVQFRQKVGLIRRHANATAAEVGKILGLKDSDSNSSAKTFSTVHTLPDGAIIDAPDSTEYAFPSQNLETAQSITSVQAELRAAGAALGLAEYMVSGDASNSNYSSTMVAEGPVVKTFERDQARLIEEDIEVLTHALRLAEKHGRLRAGLVDLIKIKAEPPPLIARNRLQDTQADEILARNKVMSRKTWAARNDLVNEDEQQEIRQEQDDDTAYDLDDPQVILQQQQQQQEL